MTLFPFDFGSVSSVQARAADLLRPDTLPPVREVVQNLLLFVPAGAVLHALLCRSGATAPRGIWRRLAAVCVISSMMSIAVESVQVFLPRRNPALFDVVVNTGGALIGALAHLALRQAGSRLLDGMRAHSPGVLYGALTLLTLVVLLVAGTVQRQTRLSNWSADFPLQVGNEREGYRPWRGRLFAFEVTDAAAPPALVRAFARNDGAKDGVEGLEKLPGVPVAQFHFAGAAPYRDHAGEVPDLEWIGDAAPPEAAGVRLPGESWLQTDGPAPSFERRLGASDAFSLRIVCATDHVDQSGPARIVSNSAYWGARNFTIAQEGDALIVRIRTPYAGPNGSKPQIVVPAVFSSLERQAILVTYDGATVLAAVAGTARVHRFPMSPGPMLASRILPLGIEADEHQMFEYVSIGGLFVIAGMLVGALQDGTRQRLIAGGIWVALFVGLFEGTLADSAGRPYSPSSALAIGTLGFAVMTLFAFTGDRARRAAPAAGDTVGATGEGTCAATLQRRP